MRQIEAGIKLREKVGTRQVETSFGYRRCLGACLIHPSTAHLFFADSVIILLIVGFVVLMLPPPVAYVPERTEPHDDSEELVQLGVALSHLRSWLAFYCIISQINLVLMRVRVILPWR